MSVLFEKLYRYDAWANKDLLDTLGTLDEEKYKVQLHTSLRLFNHSQVVMQIFAAHLSGTPHSYSADNTLDTPTLDELRAALTVSEQWYRDYLRNTSAENLSEAIPFVFTDGDKGYMTREEMLTHVVLHSGYHRAEIGRILAQHSITPPWDTFAVHLHQTEPARRQQGK
ncbi:DinB family protein [Pseudomonas costantinii]|uniref:Damage-inducible protein DinB n=1 Tax=Pseudomonas costantinii TaxID=168469 RepID=A0A1S2V363_9PSED|nr:DinB family protein [Pseudomonas costantinii]NVZ20823.1 DinB family protein [Pseudomonas costantinii]OIN53191.1 damage-inducible protein DinB [Pseudomonas costantinii]SED20458.1 Uncharacterized damage-inducible protein DinB (forms a four-helix bundle) [Pseudomonas costantinii]